jgi:type IV fimbrial biogenesis protein FimT
MPRARPASRRIAPGFTLIEVLIVVAILGIIVSMGLPSMRDLIASTKVKTAANDTFASLNIARSEAVKRNAGVQVIPNNTSNWGAGWLVRVVGTNDNLQVQDPITGDVAVSGPNTNVRYRGDGRLVDANGAVLASAVAFTFIATGFNHIQMRCIKIDPSGRPSVRTDTDRDSTNGCN